MRKMELDRKPPNQINKFILVLAFATLMIVSFYQAGQHSSQESGMYMMKSRFYHKVSGISQELLKVISPALFMEQTENEAGSQEQSSILNRIYDLTCPVLSYIKEYGDGTHLTVAAQTVPVSYLENGGEEEDSGYVAPPETSGQDATENTTEKAIAKDAVTEEMVKQENQTSIKKKKGKKNHTYSSRYTDRQLSSFSFLKSTFYSIDGITPVTSKDLNAKKLLSKDLSIDKSGNEPKILLYHTHGSEAFANSRSGKKADTVIGVGDVLAKELQETYGIPVYHDRTVYDVVNGKLDRSQAYNVAGDSIQRILKEHPSIEVVIDLHRDGVADSTRLVTTVEGKKTAQIMFFNGMSRIQGKGDIAYLKNSHRSGNLAFSLQLQLAAMDEYDNFTRKIFLRSYRYNLHYKDRSVLIEAGAQTNTVKEVKNAMYPLAKVLNEVLSKK